MKKTFLCFIATLLILISGISLVGCDIGTGTPAIPDYNADIQVVAPEDIDAEHFAVINAVKFNDCRISARKIIIHTD